MTRSILVLITVMVLLVTVPAAGQVNDETIEAGNVELLPADGPVAEWALAGGFLLASLGIGFLPARRADAKTDAPDFARTF